MNSKLRRLFPQPAIGAITLTTALLLLLASWTVGPYRTTAADGPAGLTSLFLVVSVVLTFRFPIHLRRDAKVYMASIPLYLIAALLAPPLAAITAGLGVATSQLNIRAQRGGYLSDVATETGRWIVLVLAGSIVAHLHVSDNTVIYIAAAAILWAGDMLTCPLVLAPINGESPPHIIASMVRQAGLAEGAQYLVGLLGVMAALQRLWALGLLALPTALVYVAFKHAVELSVETRRLLENMADTVDLRDPRTGGHSRRVATLVDGILGEMDMHGPERDLIVLAARIHDIGKIGVPDAVLHKPGPLTMEERCLIEMHPEQGANLLLRYPDFARGVEIVLHHHERWDGEGYPHHRSGSDIPFGARVIAVADSFDAMTSDRPYRGAMTPDTAAEILREGRGSQWDPAVVDAFLQSIASDLDRSTAPLLRIVSDTPGEGGPAALG